MYNLRLTSLGNFGRDVSIIYHPFGAQEGKWRILSYMIVVLKLFYITYKACEIKSAGWKSMKLSSAQGLLTVFITMHVIQLFLLIYKLTGNSVTEYGRWVCSDSWNIPGRNKGD